jgi:hypothetical protein
MKAAPLQSGFNPESMKVNAFMLSDPLFFVLDASCKNQASRLLQRFQNM